MKSIISVLIAILIGGGISETCAKENNHTPWIYELLPSGTHFYNGYFREGIAFVTSETAFLAAGILVNDRLEKEKRNELNIPLLFASQIYAIDKWRYYQKRQITAHQKYPYDKNPVKYDGSSLSKLLSAPFTPEVSLSTFVMTWAALGIIDGIISYTAKNKYYSDISSVYAQDRHMSREKGTAYYELSSFVASYGAAVSEEMIFRGCLLPILDSKFGKKTGLLATSLIFGLLHIFNKDIDRPVYFISQATAAGFILGYHVQHNDYKLSKAISAHFWYNFVSMTTTWIANPSENPLGVGVSFVF